MSNILPILLVVFSTLGGDTTGAKVSLKTNNSTYDTSTLMLNITNSYLVISNNNNDTFYSNYEYNLSDFLGGDEVDQIYLRCSNFYLQNDGDDIVYFNYDFTILVKVLNQNNIRVAFNERIEETFQVGESLDGFSYEDNESSFRALVYDYELFTGYDRGYSEGNLHGNENGYKVGYKDGVEDTKSINNVIDWFGSIINSVTNFLSLQIAPGVTLGLLFGVPIFVGALWFLLRALIN